MYLPALAVAGPASEWPFQKFPGALVVEENAAVGVADQDAFGKLRHEGGQKVLFLFQVGLGHLDFLFHVGPGLFDAVGACVDGVGQPEDFLAALHLDSVGGVHGVDQRDFFGELVDGDDVVVEDRVQDETEPGDENEPDSEYVDEVLLGQIDQEPFFGGGELLPQEKEQGRQKGEGDGEG